jgi:hypothetical protein
MSAPSKQASLFGNRLESNLRSCVKMVETVISRFGVDPDVNRLKTAAGPPAWGLRRGSASIYIFLQPGENTNYIQVVSPVVKLPEARVDELLRRLLELNASALVGAAFGLRGDDVVVNSDRSTVDLEPSEVEEMIRRVGGYADRYDDELSREFAARKVGAP